jgi:hypothetical protein
MTKFRNKPVSVIRNWNLDIVWDLACLREAASAKAGAWKLAFLKCRQYLVAILRTIFS